MEAVIFTGIQATGKSTFYEQQFSSTHLRLNLDMLRTRHREAIFLRACIETQMRFVVDNTNPTRADRARYIEPARAAHYRVIGYYFESRLADALRRNAARSGRARIPDAGIAGTSNRLELPAIDEGFDALYYVKLGNDGDFIVQDWRDEL